MLREKMFITRDPSQRTDLQSYTQPVPHSSSRGRHHIISWNF